MPYPPRLQQIIEEMSARLQPVCTRMSAEEFGVMVEEMAGIQYKYERRARAEFVRMFLDRPSIASDDLSGTLGQ